LSSLNDLQHVRHFPLSPDGKANCLKIVRDGKYTFASDFRGTRLLIIFMSRDGMRSVPSSH